MCFIFATRLGHDYAPTFHTGKQGKRLLQDHRLREAGLRLTSHTAPPPGPRCAPRAGSVEGLGREGRLCRGGSCGGEPSGPRLHVGHLKASVMSEEGFAFCLQSEELGGRAKVTFCDPGSSSLMIRCFLLEFFSNRPRVVNIKLSPLGLSRPLVLHTYHTIRTLVTVVVVVITNPSPCLSTFLVG